MEAEQPVHDTPTERIKQTVAVRQGSRNPMNRYVLVWSMGLILVAFAALFLWYRV